MSKFNELKIYSRLSWMAYGDDKKAIMSNYTVIATSPINSSGFQAIIYQKGTEKILAIRGIKTKFKEFNVKKFLLFFIVLISIIIYFATAQSRENARLVKELACPNGDYEIEIIDDNYTVEDIDKFYIYSNREIDTTKFKRPIKIHAVNIYSGGNINSSRVIAKGYDYFIPYDKITKALQEAMINGSDGYYCNFEMGEIVDQADSDKLFKILKTLK